MFRHMDHSEPMLEHVNQKLQKIEKFLENETTPIHIDVVMEPSKVHEHHCIEVKIKTPHYDVIAKREYPGVKFYEELDHVIDIAYRELREQKRRNHDDQIHRGRHDDLKTER